jgi:hypothetical protein
LQFTVIWDASRAFVCSPSLVLFALGAALLFAGSPASADGAYINQAGVGALGARTTTQPIPILPTPASPYAPHSLAFAPTPETAATSGKSLNFAQTLEIGRNNQLAQFQAGQNNVSNVGVVGGNSNNVGVWQAGNDLSNLYLVNTRGLSVGVLQPNGSAPLNMLIARLPNGALLIKK